MSKSHTDVALLSGARVQVATADVRDPRLTFLRTALAEAASLQQHVPVPEVPPDARYARMVMAHIKRNWHPVGPGGTAILKVVVKRDGLISAISVEKSGGEVVDQAAIRAVRAAGQLPPFLAGMLKDELKFQITFGGTQ